MVQTEFFDAESRGESFDYDAFLADIARRPLPEATGSRRGLPPHPQGGTENPLYGQGAPHFPFLSLSGA